MPVPGYDVRVLAPDGTEVPAGTEGAVCLRLPLPPGTLPTLWGDDDRYVSGYLSAFDGYYLTGDGGYLDEDGYLFVLGRTDDVINVAGHRLSTGTIEAALAGHPAVAECAVIGVADDLKGQVPRALVVLKGNQDVDEDVLRAELVARVRSEVGAIASLSRVDVVAALPKTRSGKILRKTMRELADGKDPVVPSTIEDAGVLDDLGPVLEVRPARSAAARRRCGTPWSPAGPASAPRGRRGTPSARFSAPTVSTGSPSSTVVFSHRGSVRVDHADEPDSSVRGSRRSTRAGRAASHRCTSTSAVVVAVLGQQLDAGPRLHHQQAAGELGRRPRDVVAVLHRQVGGGRQLHLVAPGETGDGDRDVDGRRGETDALPVEQHERPVVAHAPVAAGWGRPRPGRRRRASGRPRTAAARARAGWSRAAWARPAAARRR